MSGCVCVTAACLSVCLFAAGLSCVLTNKSAGFPQSHNSNFFVFFIHDYWLTDTDNML